MTAFVCPSKSTGSTTTLAGSRRPARTGSPCSRRNVGKQNALIFLRALADKAFTQRIDSGSRSCPRTGQTTQDGLSPSGGHLVNGAALGVDQRRQLREEHFSDREEIALSLQHAREFREIRLEPVLLFIAFRGHAEVVDHRVDVVLQLRDFPARLHLDRARKIALGDGGRDLGDSAHLGGEVGSEEIDVRRQVLPGAGGAGNVRLSPRRPSTPTSRATLVT